MKTITSPHNPVVKETVKLKQANKREQAGLALIEGEKEASLALAGGFAFEKIMFCPELFSEKRLANLDLNKTEMIALSRPVFDKISVRQNPDGLIALARIGHKNLKQAGFPANPLILVLEALEKPGNIGAIFRSADAVKADGIIVADKHTDIYNHNAIRASRGTVFTVPAFFAESKEAISWLREKGINIFVSTPDAEKNHFQADFSGPSALVIGPEHEGASRAWLQAADYKIKIPMQGKIDSLNASVSAGILLYEATRQRKNNFNNPIIE